MDYIGNTVIHKKKYGKGVIVGLRGGRIDVSFEGDIEKRTFSVPASFQNETLLFENDGGNLLKERLINEFRCSKCGELDSSIRNIDGLKLCTKCTSIYSKTCESCGTSFLKRFNIKTEFEDLCPTCEGKETFLCDDCGEKTYDIRQERKLDGKHLCKKCYYASSQACFMCNYIHHRKKMNRIYDSTDDFEINGIYVCEDCSEKYCFTCDCCKEVKLVKDRVQKENKMYCSSCYDTRVTSCQVCGKISDIDQCTEIYRDFDYIYVCKDCVEVNTFECEECKEIKLVVDLARSKYIPEDRLICKECISHCSKCGTEIEYDELIHLDSFWKSYCPDCWEKSHKECSICYREFVPSASEEDLCPYCTKNQKFIDEISHLDFAKHSFIKINVRDLDNIDRCELFTRLYENCKKYYKDGASEINREDFKYIVLTVGMRDVVLSYFPKKVVESTVVCCDVTMTELRKKSIQREVESHIDAVISKQNKKMEISSGKMTFLDFPLRLRVQTKFNKIYGKNWDGPGGYVEIGNYGDTTDFYLIGVIE